MEKKRIRLEINGVVCGLITQESEEYMRSLADEVGTMMKEVLDASPFITREAAALTAALSYCDDAKKNGKKACELQERIDELEVEAELWQEEKAAMEQAPAPKTDPEEEKLHRAEEQAAALREELEALKRENQALKDEAARKAAEKPEPAASPEKAEAPSEEPRAEAPKPATRRRRNPLRHEEEFAQEGFVSFFEKK